MKWPWQKAQQKAQFQDVLRRLIAAQNGTLGNTVTPTTCMQSPTVHAIVTAVSRRLAITPIHLFRKETTSNGRESKERLPNHPVARLLRKPNAWQSPFDFWQDATSTIIRWGRFYAYKARGSTGPIQELLPLNPGSVTVEQDITTWAVKFKVAEKGGRTIDYDPAQIFHARGPATDFVQGNSPIKDVSTAIALEILAERFGANFFRNGALPLLIFTFMEGSQGFQDAEQEKLFLADLKEAFGGDNMLHSMLLPQGIAAPNTIDIDHEKMQMIELRKFQRSVIAGAFGVPPHLVGDLERATFNNVEQQDNDFTLNVVMPVAKAFESAMERDLLTDSDRAGGVIVRFNLDSTLRASFKERQEGLRVQREMGIINADEWREIEGRNPRTDSLGDDYLHPGNMVVDGDEASDEAEPDDAAGDQAA